MRGPAPSERACHLDSVPFGGVAGAAGQRLRLRPLPGDDRGVRARKRDDRLMGEPEYRRATEKDAAAIAAVGAAVWDELGANSGLPQRPTKDGVAQLLASYGDRGAMFVSDNAGEISG